MQAGSLMEKELHLKGIKGIQQSSLLTGILPGFQYIPISTNFLTNTCRVISFHSQEPPGIAFLVQNIRPVNHDLIRKHMLFGIATDSNT